MTHSERLAAMRARNQKQPRVPLPDVKAYWQARWQKATKPKEEMTLTIEQLRQVMPLLPESRAVEYLPHLQAAIYECEINTPARIAAFLAQIAHESGQLKYWAEIWGPTLAQKRYEGRADLGNTQTGDGKRFKGRGPIQITGRSNYRKYAGLLDLPLIDKPELLELPMHGFRSAAAFWATNGLNAIADEDTVVAFSRITRRINGGYNGLADRRKYWARAKDALRDLAGEK